MTRRESEALKAGDVVRWQRDGEYGEVTETNWVGVKIVWDDGQVGVIHHDDMGEISRIDAAPNAATKE
jgi:hypothetical protein